MYRKGQGVKQDYKAAINWYRLSAEQGHAKAQVNLGVLYGTGKGVSRNPVYAHMWGNIAASNGKKNGAGLRDAIARNMTTLEIEKAQKLARECVLKEYKRC
jgi:TPR repeat protein